MFPGIGGLNPKKMQAMMKQLGINQEEIEATRVIIETPTNDIIISNPNVQKIIMQGQESFQITGDVSESSSFSYEDIKMIMEKTGKSENEAKSALQETNDIAEAILQLSE
ncbi:nascent polypeptide-associated complex protein [Candidatus Pacearchaeota archaeon]|nr:nascent polypeptide-associated complex protein [Candidatus Pacearchaeota archaeon]